MYDGADQGAGQLVCTPSVPPKENVRNIFNKDILEISVMLTCYVSATFNKDILEISVMLTCYVSATLCYFTTRMSNVFEAL